MKARIKELLFFVLISISDFCRATVNKFKDKNITHQLFTSLTPKSDVDIGAYESAIDFVFDDTHNITNIALMGAYGSGKSSIINTYEAEHPEKKFLHISLAHFGDNVFAKEDLKEKDVSSVLEGKILNQLIHQIAPSKIKESNFNIKKTEKKWKIAVTTIATTFVIFTALFFAFYEKWKSLVEVLKSDTLNKTLEPDFRFNLLIICGIILFFAIAVIIKQKGFLRYLKKVELKNILGIEIFDSKTESSFDKYLNEVIYLFQNCNVDAIVFEDLDRYEITLIFEKLREINYLVNKKNKNKTLRFFYLIKDDIFKTSDRSKFFDFIIPIIPVVDVSNASEKLSELLDKAELKNELEEHFITDLSFYINDMRLLTNIVNEYKIYSEKIGVDEGSGNQNHQFAMIVYKNLFPEDFHALQSGTGYVYSIFGYKDELIEKRKNELKEQQEKIRERINAIQFEHLKDVDELNALYFPLAQRKIRIGGQDVADDTPRVLLVNKVMKATEPVVFLGDSGYQAFDVERAIQEMNTNTTYISRLEQIELLSSEKQNAENKKILNLTQVIEFLGTQRLKDLLTHLEDENEFWNTINGNLNDKEKMILDDRNYNLIKYLIRNGYINEDYAVYSSYFYSTYLSVRDRNFILSVYNNSETLPEYKLDNPNVVLERLNPASFILRSVNNYDLLNSAIDNDRKDLLKIWFNSLEKSGKDGLNFVVEFWRQNTSNEKIVRYINSTFPHWLKLWISNDLVTETEFAEFIFKTIDFCENGILSTMNYENWLTEKISICPRFLKCYIQDINKYCSALKSINIKFVDMKYENINNKVLRFVYNNDMYKINIQNVIYLLSKFHRFDFNQRQHEICTYLIKNQDAPISKYLLSNINIFMNLLTIFVKKKFRDEQNTIALLLNNTELSLDNKILYLKNSSNKVKDIGKINIHELWPVILENNCLYNSWRNLCLYYEEIEDDSSEISETLASHMCEATAPSILRFDKLNDLLTVNVANNLRRKIIKSTFFSEKNYKDILEKMGFVYSSFSFAGLNDWQINILIELNVISKTEANYTFIKTNYSKHILDFVFLGDSQKVFKLFEGGSIVLKRSEVLELISDARIKNDDALMLLKKIDGAISIEGKNYTDEITEEILRYNFNVEDLPWILRNFNRFGNRSKFAIIEYSSLNSSRVINIANAISYLPSEIYANFIKQSILDKQTIFALRKILNNKNFNALCSEGKSPTFDNTQYNVIILSYFVQQGWISSYRLVNNKLRGYPKRKVS